MAEDNGVERRVFKRIEGVIDAGLQHFKAFLTEHGGAQFSKAHVMANAEYPRLSMQTGHSVCANLSHSTADRQTTSTKVCCSRYFPKQFRMEGPPGSFTGSRNWRTLNGMITLSKQAGGIEQSEIRVMSIECEKARGVNLAQGICDTPVPEAVREGAVQAIREGQNSYVRLDGIARLRHAISAKLKAYNRINANAESQIVVTSGSTGAFYAACEALLDAGDEAVIFEPYYGYHVNLLEAMGVMCRYVRMASPDWVFTEEALRAAITPRTKVIIVNSPGNPSGKVFSRSELGWICAAAVEHDLFVVTDEIYEYFLYDGREHISIGALPGMAQRTITISGFSKTFSITGWRIGYAACDARWKQAIGYFHDLAYICAPSPFQSGVAAGLEKLGGAFYRDLQLDYSRKRAMLCGALEQAGLAPCSPQGSYYVLADASALPGSNSKERAMFLLRETGVAAVPGDAFYHDAGGAALLRFCYAKTEGDLAQACERLMSLKKTVVGTR